MSFISLDRIRSLLAGKNKQPSWIYHTSISGSAQAQWVDMSDLWVVYQECPPLANVINRAAELFSLMDIKLVSIDDKEKEITSHPILDLLSKPNVLQSRESFLEQFAIFYFVYGNSFIHKLTGIAGSYPLALSNIVSGQIKVNTTGKIYKQVDINNIIKNYTFMLDSGEETYETKDIIFIPHKPITVLGQSKLHALRKPISNANLAFEMMNYVYQDRGGVGLISSGNKDISGGGMPMFPEERKRIEEELEKNYGLGENKRRTLITDATVQYTAMTYPTKDLQPYEGIENSIQMFVDAFNLHRDILASTKGATYENTKEGVKYSIQMGIQPLADILMNKFNNEFNLSAQKLKLIADYSYLPVMQKDKNIEAATNKTKTDVIISLNAEVKNGNMSREAAVNTLIYIHGYSQELANKLII